MRNISAKTDDVGDTLPASDFNANFRLELHSLVTDAGLSLDPEGGPDTDLDMLGKSIVINANAAQYYSDSGAVNAYVVDRVGALQPLTVLKDGTVIIFKATTTNTGATTINVDSLGVKSVVDESGAALTGNEIITGHHVFIRYNLSSDYWELIYSKSDILRTWVNSGDDFLPVASGVGTLGDATHLVEGLYLGDSKLIYFGDNQDMQINHDGINGSIGNGTGYLHILTTATTDLLFSTNSIVRWSINGTSGDLLPYTTATYDLGSPSLCLSHIYQADSGSHYFGTDQDAFISHDGSNFYLSNATGNIYLASTGSAGHIYLTTNNVTRWRILNTGTIVPIASDAYDIGSTIERINDMYLGDDGVIYLGNDQDLQLTYVNADAAYIKSSNSPIRLYAGTGTKVEFGIVSTTHMYANAAGFLPNITAVYDLGSASLEWDNVYCVTLVESSDRRKKDDIGDCLGLDFILNLSPKSYRLKDKQNDRKRHGIIAQDLEECLNMMGIDPKDFAALAYNEKSDSYGIAYTQLIGPIIQAIKELNAKIN